MATIPRRTLSDEKHQGGLNDEDEESDEKMLEVPGSRQWPVQTVENYITHFNPEMEVLFQRPRGISSKFNPEADKVWFCNSPLGISYLSSMMRKMSLNAEINPPLSNHCVRATSVTILSEANVETQHPKCITDHKSNTSIESYSTKPSFQQKQKMSAILSSFACGENFNTPEDQQIGETNLVDIPLS